MSDPLSIILAGAIATYLTRAGGHWIMSRFGVIHHRVEAALDAVPAAVLTALVAPSFVTRGPAETIALFAAMVIATRLSMTFTVALGLAILVALRTVL